MFFLVFVFLQRSFVVFMLCTKMWWELFALSFLCWFLEEKLMMFSSRSIFLTKE